MSVMREEAHLLTWYGKGIMWQDVWEMTPKEREWHLNRIAKQLKDEDAAQRQAIKRK